MESLGLWILGVAAGSFAAGMVVGHTFQSSCAAEALGSPEDREFLRDLTTRYGLSGKQQHQLRLVLQVDAERRDAISRSLQGTLLPEPQRAEMTALNTATENRIRALLDDEQRARYDRDRTGLPSAAGKR